MSPLSRACYAIAVLSFLLPAAPAAAQVVLLHTFTGGVSDGQNPSGELLLSGSILYGLTENGGGAGDGTFFQVGTNGTGFGVNHVFTGLPNDGRNPIGSLVQSGSLMYGLTESGGSANAGTLFQIGSDGGGLAFLHQFVGGADGLGPRGTLLQSGSVLYGMASGGGAGNFGTIFKTNIDGTGYTLLHTFAGSPGDGQQPNYGALVLSGSAIYGMTGGGGSAGLGTIFKINTDGTGYTILHSFAGGPGDGVIPASSLIVVGSTLFGTTDEGGTAGKGTVFSVATDGTGFRLLHSFIGGPNDGANPTDALLLEGSTLFGTTALGGADALGTLFGINTDGNDYRLMYSFLGGFNDGAIPQGALISDGTNFYGMTSEGGSANDGTVFSFTPIPEPSSFLLLTAAAAGGWALRVCRRRIGRIVRKVP